MHCGLVVITIAQQSLNSYCAQDQILHAACRIYAMVRISDNGSGWKQGVNAFRRSTIP